jgi:uncharacterized protein DUF3780
VTIQRAAKPKTADLGDSFGFEPEESRHHFLVTLSTRSREPVEISEHFTWDDETGSGPVTLSTSQDDGQLRVRLARPKWDAVADAVRVEFNNRLKRQGKPNGKWKNGPNPINRLLGKELILLAWAVEDADPSLVPIAIANWLGLACEERWWLYTMTAAATGHALNGQGKGWRKAVRFALTENPVGRHLSEEPVVPEFFRLVNDHE